MILLMHFLLHLKLLFSFMTQFAYFVVLILLFFIYLYSKSIIAYRKVFNRFLSSYHLQALIYFKTRRYPICAMIYWILLFFLNPGYSKVHWQYFEGMSGVNEGAFTAKNIVPRGSEFRVRRSSWEFIRSSLTIIPEVFRVVASSGVMIC